MEDVLLFRLLPEQWTLNSDDWRSDTVNAGQWTVILWMLVYLMAVIWTMNSDDWTSDIVNAGKFNGGNLILESVFGDAQW